MCDMKRQWLILPLLLLLLTIIFAWQLPALLKAVPSRYVARLPEPVQALGVREHVAVLPTAAVAGDVSHLLLDVETPPALSRQEAAGPVLAPATPTPPPTVGVPGAHGTGEVATQVTAEVTAPTATSTATPSPLPTATVVAIPGQARLTGIQHRFQDWNNCGPATLAMGLSYFDVYHSQEQTASVLKPDPEDRNVNPWEMASYVQEETEYEAVDRTNGDLYTLRRLLSSGYPVIVEVGIDPPGDFAWMEWYGHYLLPVAYDDAQETFWVYDSWFGTSDVPQQNADDEGRQISYEELDSYWQHFNRHYIVLYPPGEAERVAEIVGENMDDEVMWQNALRRVQRDLQAEPEDKFLWFNLGTIYNALGDYERAAAAFDKARSLELPWRMLWYQFGPYEAYYKVGRYQEVIELADVTLQDRPYFEEAFYYKGLAQEALGDEREAEKNLEKAASFNPNFAPAQVALEDLRGSQ